MHEQPQNLAYPLVVESAFEFITPFDAKLYEMLRQTHINLAYGLVGVIAAHVSRYFCTP